MRAQIALVAHRGKFTTAIVQALGVSVHTVSYWLTRLVLHCDEATGYSWKT
ncbi:MULTISPECIES: hypothetical protein [Burkholderiaceae]|uniref:Putative transposase n=1 Tax=Caballeronia sordidicola TaxID=196367 RepID=A0A242N6N0_CABSO|nr:MULTISPECIES: hypothetical protein [Burkholderiaceae]OTP79325.1 putative transposase [Caballeronia sordidicola]